MKDMIDTVKTLRELKSKDAEVVSRLENIYQSTPEFQEYCRAKEDLQETIEFLTRAENNVRERALQISKETNYEQRDVQGIQIKQFNIVEITDEKSAKEWASVNAPDKLKLDVRGFKSAVKALDLPFLEKSVEYKAQIPSKL